MTSNPDGAPPDAVWTGLRRLAELPAWLKDGVQPELVSAATQALPELARGALTVQECRVRQPRLDGDHWTARYQMTVREPGRPLRRVALVGQLYPPGHHPPGHHLPGHHLPTHHPPGLHPTGRLATAEGPPRLQPGGPFGSPDWRAWLPELGLALLPEPIDLGLPALRILTDPARAPGVLEQAIRASSAAYGDVKIAACTPRLLRQHPGRRATIAFDLAYSPADAPGGRPDRVVAKTYADDTGRQTDEAMRVLWAARRPGSALAVAEPLGYLPDLRLLVQGWVTAKQTFTDVLRNALATGEDNAIHELVTAAEMAAAALAALHTSNVECGAPVGIDDELTNLANLADDLAALVGDLAGVAAPLLGWLSALVARGQADDAVPTHGSFHPGQALLGDDHVGVIDFDGLCRAEPALDVAQFLATTKYLAVRARRVGGDTPSPVSLARLAHAEHVCARFLRRYQTLAPVSPARVALWETLHLFAHVLHCWTGIRPHRVASTIGLLSRQLRTFAASGQPR